MNIIQLFQDFNVPYYTEGYKYCRPGWINVECPWCSGNPGPHLGFNLETSHCNCWRCGWHPLFPTIAKIFAINENKAKEILNQYGGVTFKQIDANLTKIRLKPYRLPSNTEPMQKNHKQYLEKRGFDPERLEHEWKLLGTAPISTLDHINYRFRIIIPFIWNDHQISFDSRDITGYAINKYQACPKDRELIPHKQLLYGKQECWSDIGICVEGYTKVWRLGVNSFATCGINYTQEQVKLMTKTFKRIAVIFDTSPLKNIEKKESEFNKKTFIKSIQSSKETQAEIQANKLVSDLRFRGVDAFKFHVTGDVADLPQNEANYLLKQIIK
jgi:hypothetical protein